MRLRFLQGKRAERSKFIIGSVTSLCVHSCLLVVGLVGQAVVSQSVIISYKSTCSQGKVHLDRHSIKIIYLPDILEFSQSSTERANFIEVSSA